MREECLDELIKWVNKERETDFSQFALLLHEANKKKAGVRIEVNEKIYEGKVTDYNIAYNTKFPDMDIDITYSSPRAELIWGVSFQEVTKNDIKREGDRAFRILNQQSSIRIVLSEN